ncbi:ABC transporter substrate-binding protein [Vibrio sp. JC009]|uniref:ABC transporter substrate-binding protein n=1 Tax=Vibrio sp. JC009 TaxID=2912314 RepID=UPI0023B1C046|nr:ABC transporter substrate-binding protein [Vibrio sp. JC009]WED23451.1 ABC transporter substrate-binding protein [Vibrio sp. JC009]
MKILTPLVTAMALMLPMSAVQAAPQESTVNMSVFWLDGDIEPTTSWNGWTVARVGIGENLIQIDENLQFKPVIAQSWKQVDELTTEFTIRDGIKFHNGKVADAKAVKASLERALEMTNRKDMKIPVDTIEADGNKLTVKTTRPYATLLNMLADPVFIIIDAQAASENPDGFKYQPVATGPFMVESFSSETGIVMKKHADHWRGEPGVDKVNVKYISDESTRAMALQSGELDFAPQISPADLTVLEKDENLKVLSSPNLRIFFVRTNFAKPWMKSPEFRQAIHHAIHKDVYAEKIAGGIPARGPFNQLLPFGHKGADSYGYDQEKAIQLLDKAGFVDTDGDGIRELDGKNIVLQYISMTNHGAQARNIGIAMQSELKKVGIGMEVKQMENHTEAAKQGQYDFLFERWTSAPTLDPQYFLSSFIADSHGNSGKYSNPKFDSLMDELSRTIDKEKRTQLGAEGAKMLMDDVSGIFLFYQKGNVVYNKRISGVHKFVSEVYYIDERLKLAND